MAPKSKNGAIDTALRTDVSGNEIGASEAPATDNDGINPPPYDAKWITIDGAAKIVGVTSQTVRNAYAKHAAFNPVMALDEAGVPQHKPAWFATKMIDGFGNTTGYDVVYLDHAAVLAWQAARADAPATTHSGAKRQIMRLTDAQVAAYNSGDYSAAFDLADGTRVAIEKPPMSRPAKKAAVAEHTNGVTAPQTSTEQGGLFDVELIEA